MHKHINTRFVIAALLVLGSRTAFAQTATQSVTFQVDAINQLSVSGSPSLLINAPTAGLTLSVTARAASRRREADPQTGARRCALRRHPVTDGITFYCGVCAKLQSFGSLGHSCRGMQTYCTLCGGDLLDGTCPKHGRLAVVMNLRDCFRAARDSARALAALDAARQADDAHYRLWRGVR